MATKEYIRQDYVRNSNNGEWDREKSPTKYSITTEDKPKGIPFAGLLSFETFILFVLFLVIAPAFTYFTTNKDTIYAISESYSELDQFNENARRVGIELLDRDLDDVSDIYDLRTEDAFYTTYHGMTFNEWCVLNGVAVLSLTNLISNGQFTSNINGWGTGTNYSISWDAGKLKVTLTAESAGQSFAYASTSPTAATVYYYRFSGSISRIGQKIDMRVGVAPAYFTPASTSMITYSKIVTAIDTNPYRVTTSVFEDDVNDIVYFDDVSVFASGTMTKTQIDTAISYYGYLTYNVTYNLPDTSDPDFASVEASYYNGAYEAYLVYYADTNSAINLMDITDPRFPILIGDRLQDCELNGYNVCEYEDYWHITVDEWSDVGNLIVVGFKDVVDFIDEVGATVNAIATIQNDTDEDGDTDFWDWAFGWIWGGMGGQ